MNEKIKEIDENKKFLIDYVFWLEDKVVHLTQQKTELLWALELLLQLEPQDDNVCYEVQVARETVARVKDSTFSEENFGVEE